MHFVLTPCACARGKVIGFVRLLSVCDHENCQSRYLGIRVVLQQLSISQRILQRKRGLKAFSKMLKGYCTTIVGRMKMCKCHHRL